MFTLSADYLSNKNRNIGTKSKTSRADKSVSHGTTNSQFTINENLWP